MMHGLASHLRRLFRDENGVTAIEYGLIASGICLALITVLNTLGVSLNTAYAQIPAWFP